MKKTLGRWAILGILAGLTCSSALEAQTWTLPYKAREIRVDGVLDDWEGIPEIVLRPGETTTEGTFEGSDLTVRLRGVWDEQSLYMALDWEDDVWDVSEVRRRDSVFVTADKQRRDRMYFFDNFKILLNQLDYSYLLWFSPRANEQGPFYWNRLLKGTRAMEAASNPPVITPRQEGNRLAIELLFQWKEMQLQPNRLVKKGMPLTLVVADSDAPGQILDAKLHNLSWLEWRGFFQLAKKK